MSGRYAWSEKDHSLFKILGNFGYMSAGQAAEIYHKYYNDKLSWGEHRIEMLIKDNAVRATEDKAFIMPSISKMVGDRKSVLALYIIMEHAKDISDLIFAGRMSDGGFSFVSDNVCYNIYPIKRDEISRMLLIEKRFLTEYDSENAKFVKNIFLFDVDVDEDDALEKIEELHLRHPHILYFTMTKDLENKPKFDIFDMADDE